MGKDFEQACKQATESIRKGKCNILIIGKTGVGKSTLINAIFGEKMADASAGKPVTQFIKPYNKPELNNFTIYDTPGLELSNLDKAKRDVSQLIEQQRKCALEEHIHLIWYCVNEMSDRIESKEKQWIEELRNKDLPVIIVLTKGTGEENIELVNCLKEFSDIYIRVLNEPKKIVHDFKVKVQSPNLERLVKTTTQNLPKIAQAAFMIAVSNIDLKRKAATTWLIPYVASAFTIPFLFPIPFLAKKVSATAVQTTMLVHLFNLFELPLERKIIGELVSLGISLNLIDLSVDFSVENIGQYIADQLLQASLEDLIAGGAASLSTLVTGLAYIDVLIAYKKAQLAGQEISVTDLAEMLKNKIQEYTQPGWEILRQILDDGGGNLAWQPSYTN
ncbi:GTPase domain-containing protein [Microseira wollei]|uniref:GTP-binding protein n=1 Tax=Microseira wollei NIES-4236 TaxID=2530354 RepID=A0AAV3X5Q1_9CYAN|nr:GTPase domain-containing protein [Microseira wollei]GET37443.1 GTP-binding protein [Microseira wollei NIES-4236]